MNNIKLRFAPSPTGYLHIGGARTALFNWLYARHHGGTFILRIEDTDAARSTPESTQAILDSMNWLGLNWDEGPYFQSQHMEYYNAAIERLLEEDKAYVCTCAPQELEEMRRQAQARGEKPKYNGRCRNRKLSPKDGPCAIRFKTPPIGQTIVRDLIKGDVIFNHAELDDLVIRRSDGLPTYNFAAVVDDSRMRISHIIRGDDHLNNTPRQILLYQALGCPLPQFAHVPMILGMDRARLSKRHGATSVTSYRDEGYLPDALVNYLARLSWSSGDQEIFSREELIQKFSLENVNKSPAAFDIQKLQWLNAHYIKTATPENLVPQLLPFLKEAGYDVQPGPRLVQVIHILQERSRTLVEMAESAKIYFAETIEYDPKAAQKFLTPDRAPILQTFLDRFSQLEQFDEASIQEVFDQVMAEGNLQLKDVAQPMRVALTGGTVSPGIHETVAAIGRDKTLKRLKAVIEYINNLTR